MIMNIILWKIVAHTHCIWLQKLFSSYGRGSKCSEGFFICILCYFILQEKWDQYYWNIMCNIRFENRLFLTVSDDKEMYGYIYHWWICLSDFFIALLIDVTAWWCRDEKVKSKIVKITYSALLWYCCM